MTVKKVERAKLIVIYDELCDAWQRAVRLEENILAYLLELSILELRDRLGADLPMPVLPSAQKPSKKTRLRRVG